MKGAGLVGMWPRIPFSTSLQYIRVHACIHIQQIQTHTHRDTHIDKQTYIHVHTDTDTDACIHTHCPQKQQLHG